MEGRHEIGTIHAAVFVSGLHVIVCVCARVGVCTSCSQGSACKSCFVLQGDCLVCNSGSPTKRLLQITGMSWGRLGHVPAIFPCLAGAKPRTPKQSIVQADLPVISSFLSWRPAHVLPTASFSALSAPGLPG